jgi:prevent-host-death family protein
MDIGVRELKQRLSELVARAAKGEVIRVTDRGEPQAILGPLPGRARLEEGLREGWIQVASKAAKAAPRRVNRVRVQVRTEVALDEDRNT